MPNLVCFNMKQNFRGRPVNLKVLACVQILMILRVVRTSA